MKTPDPVDAHIGGRVRLRRLLAGLSQEELAIALCLSFQQIQKYENGSNRISAGRLYQIAEIVKAPIEFFYAGLKRTEALAEVDRGNSQAENLMGFLTISEGLLLNRQFTRIKSQKLRQQVLSLIAALAIEDLTAQRSVSSGSSLERVQSEE